MMGNIIILNMVYWTSSIKGVFEYSLFNEIKQGIINTSVFYKKSINKYIVFMNNISIHKLLFHKKSSHYS